jgi:hypothetical protein
MQVDTDSMDRRSEVRGEKESAMKMLLTAACLVTLVVLLTAWVMYEDGFFDEDDEDPAYTCSDTHCTDLQGKQCFALTNCCKNGHDWATEFRDGTVCRGTARLRVEY